MSVDLSPAPRPYTHEMVVIHRVFRREAALLPRLVRAVREGDTARSAVVGAYARGYLRGLHHHHALEDELLWPLLHERVMIHGGLVGRMEYQHRQIDRSLAAVTEVLPGWERSAGRIIGERLAEALDRHHLVLREHLDEEERSVLPLIAEHLTVAEWDAVGTRGLAELPKDQLMIALGSILEEATPEEQAYFLGKGPAVGRLMWRLVGRRQYARRCQELRGPLGD